MAKNKVAVVQFAARNKYLVAQACAQAGILDNLYTDIWLRGRVKDIVQGLSPHNKIFKRYANRYSVNIPSNRVVSYDLLGYIYLLKRVFSPGAYGYVKNEYDTMKIFLKKVSCELADYDGIIYTLREAMEVFARSKNATKIMEEVNAHAIYVKLLKEERIKWGGWEIYDDEKNDKLWDEILERERSSYEMADCIVAPSEWVRSYIASLGINAEKIRMIPYWCNPRPSCVPKRFNGKRKLRILCLGRVALIKGVQYLFEAARFLKEEIDLKVVGQNFLAEQKVSELRKEFNILPHMPLSEIQGLYDWADIFVLPTLCEGSALVVYEALSQGVPVVTTPNCGSIVADNAEGFIVPPGSSEMLQKSIASFIENPSLVEKYSENALLKARTNTIEDYCSRVVQMFSSVKKY